jgi:hypothetical protein
MNTATFNKRIYNLPTFTTDVKNIFDHMDALRHAARGGRVSHAFAEKIMMVVHQCQRLPLLFLWTRPRRAGGRHSRIRTSKNNDA